MLEWDDLVARLGLLATGRADGCVGEWDVVRALLRLELPSAQRLGELDAVRGGPSVNGLDLADIVSAWVASGGLPEREIVAQPYRILPISFSPCGPTRNPGSRVCAPCAAGGRGPTRAPRGWRSTAPPSRVTCVISAHPEPAPDGDSRSAGVGGRQDQDGGGRAG